MRADDGPAQSENGKMGVMKNQQNMSAKSPHTVEVSRLYEAYPHLIRIDELWGSAECRSLLLLLLSDTRDGERRGFPREHAATLMRLLIAHDQQFPAFDDSFSGLGFVAGLERDHKLD